MIMWYTPQLDSHLTIFQLANFNQKYHKQQQLDYDCGCRLRVAGGFQLLYNYYKIWDDTYYINETVYWQNCPTITKPTWNTDQRSILPKKRYY